MGIGVDPQAGDRVLIANGGSDTYFKLTCDSRTISFGVESNQDFVIYSDTNNAYSMKIDANRNTTFSGNISVTGTTYHQGVIAIGTGPDGSWPLRVNGAEYHAGGDCYLYNSNVYMNGTLGQTGTSNLATLNVSATATFSGTITAPSSGVVMKMGGQRFLHRDGTALYIGETYNAAEAGIAVEPLQFRAGGVDVLHLAIDKLATFSGGANFNGDVYIDGDLAVTGTIPGSDVRLKENIRDVNDLLPIINKMEVKKFNKIGKTEDKVGIIAQQIKEFFPEAVAVRDVGPFNDTHYVETLCLVGALIGAVQELDTKVKELEEN